MPGCAKGAGAFAPGPAFDKDILNHLHGDVGSVATTMVDYYGLPRGADDGWPGRAAAPTHGTAEDKARFVEIAMLNDFADEMRPRFVPFVVMHEFEALLFSDSAAFSRAIYRPELEPQLQAVRDQFATPEDINDSVETAPSKRVEQLVVGYQKPLLGILAAIEIGLDKIRASCNHFDAWLGELERLAGSTDSDHS